MENGIKISLSNLPSQNNILIGREDHLNSLNELLSSQNVRIIAIIAPGGIGKTSLINEWLNRIEKNSFNGVKIVYGWSFYSQGKFEAKQISDKDFIADIQDFLNLPNEILSGNIERKIVSILAKEKSLIYLDGLEPLQKPPGDGMGKFIESAYSIKVFLREFIRNCHGLCILTSRTSISDLIDNTYYREINLEKLSKSDGMQLLRQFGISGKENELKQASEEYNGHALALTLLGSYIMDVFSGDIRKRDLIKKLTNETQYGEHAKRILYAYELWLKGKPELDILYILCVFDRPAENDALRRIIDENAIDGITSNLKYLCFYDYMFALRNLERLKLITILPNGNIESHPLIREYFEERLKANNFEGFKEAHRRLYEYYKSIPKETPETISEMAPLYTAVIHGTKAGLYIESLNEVYKKRITRNGHFNLHNHGAYSDDLATLANFFEEPWGKVINQIDEDNAIYLLSRVVYPLLGVGRYKEAIEPTSKAIEKHYVKKDWKQLAIGYGNLVEIYVPLGDFSSAIKSAENGIMCIGNLGNTPLQYITRSIAAYCHYLCGNGEAALRLFQEAENLFKANDINNEYLSSVGGARYCELLIWQECYDDAIKRGKWMLSIAEKNEILIDIGLDCLAIGRALMYKEEYTQSEQYLNIAVERLRMAGQQECIISGLLGRAEYYIKSSKFGDARFDIDEAYTLAVDTELTLYLIDCYFEFAKLYIEESDFNKVTEYYELIRTMLQGINYGSKYKELDRIQSYITKNN